MKDSNKLDKFLYKIISRKLLVFVTSTVFFSLGMMGADQYLIICTAYIGLQTFSDTVTRVKGSFESTQMVQKSKKILEELNQIKGGLDDDKD